MSKYELDFSDVQSAAAVPVGNYDVVINAVEMRQSETGAYPYLNWECQIAAGEYEGRKIYMITSLSPKALWKLQETLLSFGFDNVSGGKLELDLGEETSTGTRLNDPSFEGMAAIATVFTEPYGGRQTSKISDLVAANAATVAEGPAIATKNGGEAPKANPFRGKQAGTARSFK